MILAVDDNTVAESSVDVLTALDKIEKRDLSLSNPLDPSKYYNEMRNSLVLRKDESHEIEDITSTNYIMIDSLERVLQVQKEVRKATSQYITDDLSFLIKWGGYTQEEKNKKYSQFVCHEVNLFIYFKDPEYFKSVVRPFIANKMEKSFIDLWLVGDHDAVIKYKAIEHFDRLNTLEKCLLISEVVKDNKEFAQVLVNRIKLLSDQKDIKIDVSNRIIDTVINLNMTQNQQPSSAEDYSSLQMSELKFREFNYDFQQNKSYEESESLDRNRSRGFGGGGMMKMAAMRMPAAKPLSKFQSNLFDEEEYKVDKCDYSEERKTTKTQFQEAEAATEYWETHYYKNQNILNPSL